MINSSSHKIGKVSKKKKTKTKKKQAKFINQQKITTMNNNQDTATPVKTSELHIVPWFSREQWEHVCGLVHGDGDTWDAAVKELTIWEVRVPVLPLVIESTLLLLQAKLYDRQLLLSDPKAKDQPHNHSIGQARSLYSMALIRYLNHAGQTAVTALGESTTTMPTKELTSSVGIPDWIVSLRNEVTHGARVPSLEALRVAGNFILEWLKEFYWKLPSSATPDPQSTKEDAVKNDAEKSGPPHPLRELLRAFVSARIYKLKNVSEIKDIQITKHLQNKPRKTKIKSAIRELRQKILTWVRHNWELACPVFAEILIPPPELYSDYLKDTQQSHFNGDLFELLMWLWNPITKVLRITKGALCKVLVELGKIHVDDEDGVDEYKQELSAKWIRKFLDQLQESGQIYSVYYIELLKIVIINPNPFTKIFLSKLLKVLDSKLNHATKVKLEMLAAIWVGDNTPTLRADAVNQAFPPGQRLFTMEDVVKQLPPVKIPKDNSAKNATTTEGQSSERIVLDNRSSEYWSNIPFGFVED